MDTNGIGERDCAETVRQTLLLESPAFGSVKKSVFGVKTVENRGGRIALNGKKIFLRCETNCALFPETGHWPMDRESWKKILKKYREYGVNCVRFHSHCRSEAAFEATDETGSLHDLYDNDTAREERMKLPDFPKIGG